MLSVGQGSEIDQPPRLRPRFRLWESRRAKPRFGRRCGHMAASPNRGGGGGRSVASRWDRASDSPTSSRVPRSLCEVAPCAVRFGGLSADADIPVACITDVCCEVGAVRRGCHERSVNIAQDAEVLIDSAATEFNLTSLRTLIVADRSEIAGRNRNPIWPAAGLPGAATVPVPLERRFPRPHGGVRCDRGSTTRSRSRRNPSLCYR